MNSLVIVLAAAVCLIAAYALYGRWLARKWESTRRRRRRQFCIMTGRTMFRQMGGPSLPISFLPSQVQDL